MFAYDWASFCCVNRHSKLHFVYCFEYSISLFQLQKISGDLFFCVDVFCTIINIATQDCNLKEQLWKYSPALSCVCWAISGKYCSHFC